ncbi:MAG TPA: hypothetical protein VF073_07405 [Gaiella sp.]
MRRLFIPCAVTASVLALTGCGGDGSSQTTEATTDTGSATTTQITTTDTTSTAPAAPKPTTITIVVADGRPRGGIQRPTVQKGEQVVLVIRSDAGEEVHLHGYDIEKPVTPGTPVRIPFTANLPGRFELELHHPDALLAVVEVQP